MTLNEESAVREQYRDASNFAARVDLHARFSTNPQGWFEFVFERYELPPDASVLEVGCGPGWLWHTILDRLPPGWRVVATDMSHGMAGEARKNVEDDRFEVLVTDAQSLPFPDETFDAVVANHMLYHVPDLNSALSEFVRVLRPDGKLYAATNGQKHFKEVRDLLGTHQRYIGMFGLETGPDKIAPFFKDVTVERYDDALEVPDVEPVVSYMTSMSTFWDLGDERESLLRRTVAEEIERRGTFHISKDAGLITGTKR